MIKGKGYVFLDVEIPIDNPREGVVYHCPNDRRIDFICPCGCGSIITLNTLKDTKPCWEIVNYKTIKPSINKIIGCKTHFSIINGIVE